MRIISISLHYKVKNKSEMTKEPSLGTPERVPPVPYPLGSKLRHFGNSRTTLVLAAV